ncbi:MAG: DUF839 domain-containing protein [Oligoflexales bacterium]|nr:DUF839 domain-containing protein [Oligoflexales bacterium]
MKLSGKNQIKRRSALIKSFELGASLPLLLQFPSAFAADHKATNKKSKNIQSKFSNTLEQDSDELSLAPGYEAKLLINYGDVLSHKKDVFGDCNDLITCFPYPNKDSLRFALLGINHEEFHPLYVSGRSENEPVSPEHLKKEMHAVGVSIIAVEKRENGFWQFIENDPYNRRLDANTIIEFSGQQQIAGSSFAKGTLANCSGGKTPWGTFISGEENYQDFFGDQVLNMQTGKRDFSSSSFGWETLDKRPPEHYGWLTEINPFNGSAKKLIPLGRFRHEGATIIISKDKRAVAYSGNDRDGGCIYKFVSDTATSLDNGTLYVASIDRGEWLALDIDKNADLKKNFKSQLDVLINCHAAARLIGGTAMERPEDIKIDPKSGAVYVALTNSVSRGNYNGYVLRISEQEDYSGRHFNAEPFIAGGQQSGFYCPDNLMFDSHGDLWLTTDVTEKMLGKGPYAEFKRNALFKIPMSGPNQYKPTLIAKAPFDAEFTSPCLAPDGKVCSCRFNILVRARSRYKNSPAPGQL